MVLPHFFSSIRTIAVVGLSDRAERQSHQVARYLKDQGYVIIPVNPNVTSVLDQPAYPSLLAIPEDIQIDVVNLFRRPDHILIHVQEAIQRPENPTIWMQEGIIHPAAAELAQNHGHQVVMNTCLMHAHQLATGTVRH